MRPISTRAFWPAGIALLLLLVAFVVVPPWPIVLLDADTLAYAVCHRIPSHSFTIAGRQLPLCARCTGIYIGALAGLGFLAALRPRAREMPSTPVLAAFLLFITLMAVDGLNSFLTLIPVIPSVYTPQNWLRLLTGAFHGIAMAGLLYPIFNMTVWKDGWEVPAVTGKILTALAGAALLINAVVLTEADALLWPLYVLSGVGVLALVGMLNTTLVVVVLRHENSVVQLSDAVPFALWGLALTFVELGVINLLRHWLEASLGLAFY